MAAIIRTLWGCAGPIHRWSKVWLDVRIQLRRKCHCKQYVYVYGKDNANRLKDRGRKNIEIILVDDSPFPDGKIDHKRSEKGTPIRPWHYKHELLLKAVEDHGEIFYCDWDVTCLANSVDQALEYMEGRDLALSAVRYFKKRYMYREEHSPRFGVSGNWMFARGPEWFNRVLETMKKDEIWAWHDEYVMTRLIDQDYENNWIGEDNWLRKWESPIMIQKSSWEPWLRVKEKCTDFEIVRNTPIPFTWYKLFSQ